MAVFFLCTNQILAALGKRAEGGRGVGWVSAQQRASGSQRRFHSAFPSAAAAAQMSVNDGAC